MLAVKAPLPFPLRLLGFQTSPCHCAALQSLDPLSLQRLPGEAPLHLHVGRRYHPWLAGSRTSMSRKRSCSVHAARGTLRMRHAALAWTPTPTLYASHPHPYNARGFPAAGCTRQDPASRLVPPIALWALRRHPSRAHPQTPRCALRHPGL